MDEIVIIDECIFIIKEQIAIGIKVKSELLNIFINEETNIISRYFLAERWY